MEFRLLGPLEVVDDDKTIPITGAKERKLLAALLLHTNEVVSADRLIDLLWGEHPPGKPSNALHQLVTRLRRTLGPAGSELLVTKKPGYCLAAAAEQVDALCFERLVTDARNRAKTNPWAVSAQLRQALDLWRGPLLFGLADDVLIEQERVRLDELRLAAVEERIEADLALGRHADMVGELYTLVNEHPFRERPRRQLMLALYQSGRQAEALQVYQDTRALLRDELGLDPGRELQELHQAILRRDSSLGVVEWLEPMPSLPARITSFVGRGMERDELLRLVAHNRLVTVIGPGGAGKTSLAVEAARSLVRTDQEGRADVLLVEVAPLSDPSQVSRACSDALGLRGTPAGAGISGPANVEAQLEDALRGKQLLMLLDNCEHLVTEVARLSDRLLRAAPGLRILATSREPLGLLGEAAWSIPGLSAPDSNVPHDQLWDFDAVRLFDERAAAAKPGFRLDDETGPVVAEICRRLDGLPLAIELAAARVRTLPVQEIARRLDDRFRLLTSGSRTALPRQQTLRAAIDWSYDLLSNPERILLARLSVFAGTWSLDTAEAVCGDQTVPPLQLLDLLSRLVDRCLVIPEPGPAARFRLLETIRQYARERLNEAGETDHLLRRHAVHFLAVAEAAGMQPATAERLASLEETADDVRVALDWALSMRADDLLLRFGGALGWFWATWHDSEGIARMHTILAAVPPSTSAEYGRALQAFAFVDSYAPTAETKRRARRSVDLLERFGDRAGAARSKLILSFIELMLGGDQRLAGDLIESADQTSMEVGDEWGRALAALSRFRLHLHAGHLAQGVDVGRDAIRRFRALDDAWGIPWTTLWLAIATRTTGNTQAAAHLFEDAITSSERLRYVTCSAHAELGGLAALAGEHQRADVHHQRALELAPETGVRDAVGMAWNAAGFGARLRGSPEEAKARHLQAVDLFEELGSQIGMAHSLGCLGFAENHLGEVHQSRQHFGQVLQLAADATRPDLMAAALEGLACAAASDDPEGCAVLLGAARSIRDETGIRLTMIEGHDPAGAQTHVRSQLGPRRLVSAMERGKRLPSDQVLTIGLHAARAIR
jgi:predicted ATPase/DNA-binding SARP family transcriptional activator